MYIQYSFLFLYLYYSDKSLYYLCKAFCVVVLDVIFLDIYVHIIYLYNVKLIL